MLIITTIYFDIITETECDYLDHSADIDDIDARLQRIQDMMKGGI